MMRKFRERAEEAPWQLISSSSSRSAPMCGTTASGRTRNDGRCTGVTIQYSMYYPTGTSSSYASTISFLQYLENKCDRRRGARDLIVGRQVKQTFPHCRQSKPVTCAPFSSIRSKAWRNTQASCRRYRIRPNAGVAVEPHPAASVAHPLDPATYLLRGGPLTSGLKICTQTFPEYPLLFEKAVICLFSHGPVA